MSSEKRHSTHRRAILVALVVGLAALSWIVKVAVESALADGRAVDLGLLQLRLTYNPGVSFSLGADLPTWVVLAGTGLVTAVIAGYAWSVAPTVSAIGLTGLGAVLAGALTNLVNRAVDGAVTDYLHTGWFPTFNMPDSLITVGAVLVVISLVGPEARRSESRPA